MESKVKSVAIIGAGPVGLAAAAHVLERGLEPIVLEAGPEVGHAMAQWSHVQLFSPWSFNVDKASERLLAAAGWNAPEPDVYPTGGELRDLYLKPLAALTPLRERLRTNSKVISISRVGFDKVKTKGREGAPFELRYQNGEGARALKADAVIDTSGTWSSPNPAGGNGLPAIGEDTVSHRIRYGMPDVLGRDRARYEGCTVAVLGAGHSAIGTLLDLSRLAQQAPATRVVWLVRGTNPSRSFGGGANDALSARGELGSAFAQIVTEGRVQVEIGFSVSHLSETDGKLRVGAGSGCCGRHVLVDELVVSTGFRPDLGLLSELRTSLDPALECPPALAPLIDPNEHSCGTVRPHGAAELSQPEPGLYIAGMKSYGRAPTFLMMTGYEQVRSIAAELAGDHEAAQRVELALPETGVCNISRGTTASGCCGAPEPAATEAACRTSAKTATATTAAPEATTRACCG